MIHIKLCFVCKKETVINIYSSQRTSAFVKKVVYALYYYILSLWLHLQDLLQVERFTLYASTR